MSKDLNGERAIYCEKLVKRYKDKLAVDNLDLVVPEGSIFGFLGPNGAGKTTTIRMLTGLIHPTSGKVKVAGFAASGGSPLFLRQIGYLDQQPQLYSWMKGREFLEFTGKFFDLSGLRLRSRVDEILEQTGLTRAANRRIGAYSGGMRQRLGLAQALLPRPRVLFLDEPVSALDPGGRRDILSILEGLRGQTTVFMSTHILADIERVCDRVAIIREGKLMIEATMSDLQEQYAQPIFFIEPEHNQVNETILLIERLKAQSWVTGVSHAQEVIKVSTNDPVFAGRGIIQLSAEVGILLARFERSRPDLEEIFLRLVGEE